MFLNCYHSQEILKLFNSDLKCYIYMDNKTGRRYHEMQLPRSKATDLYRNENIEIVEDLNTIRLKEPMQGIASLYDLHLTTKEDIMFVIRTLCKLCNNLWDSNSSHTMLTTKTMSHEFVIKLLLNVITSTSVELLFKPFLYTIQKNRLPFMKKHYTIIFKTLKYVLLKKPGKSARQKGKGVQACAAQCKLKNLNTSFVKILPAKLHEIFCTTEKSSPLHDLYVILNNIVKEADGNEDIAQALDHIRELL